MTCLLVNEMQNEEENTASDTTVDQGPFSDFLKKYNHTSKDRQVWKPLLYGNVISEKGGGEKKRE